MNPFEKDWAGTVEVNVKVSSPPKQPEGRDITILLDRSGSMSSMRDAVVESLNSKFDTMKKEPGKSNWNVLQFDEYNSAKGAGESFPSVIFEGRSEKDMQPIKKEEYVPRGGTALIDATCLTMQRIDSRISGQATKPTVMIVTDGYENSSQEFTTAKMREMIAERQKKGWEFIYIGANQDAWGEASKFGMANANVNNYQYANSSVASGSVASGAVNAFSFEATARGIGQAIGSGLVGCFHTASGQDHF